jgi:uncharacterized protein YecT (DUF1311 family)
MKKMLLALLAILVSVASRAEPDERVVQEMAKQTGMSAEEIRQSHNACESGVGLTRGICGAYRLTEQDMRLNRLYKQVLDRAKKRGTSADVVKAQRAWIAYRDAQCAVEMVKDPEGGVTFALNYLACKLSLTKQQADRLEELPRD